MTDQTLVPREQLPLPHPYTAPATPTEVSLAEIWRAVLAMDRVGIQDNYHDLGGDSFHASIIFERIQTTFGIELPLATLKDAATVARLAARIDELRAAAAASPP